MNKSGFESFLKEFSDTPANAAFVDAQFRDVDDATVDEFLEAVDGSDFSFLDWVESLRSLVLWLDSNGLTMQLSDQIGYISCAAASAGAGAHLTCLPLLVEEMLDAYGCERAVKK